MLVVSAPFHCDLMKPAAGRLEPLLAGIEFSGLSVPLVTNVNAQMIKTGGEARDALLRQVVSPVRWGESVKLLLDEGVTRFIEIGPGKVLSGLVKQISRAAEVSNEVQILNVEDEESLQATAAAIGL
jgi:[acyl-carrier-protein] S-malonyltransferase